jgi:aryl-alcohol dehydrogenase-like predicted oxidoreductase
LLHQPAVTATVVGPRSAQQVTSSLHALDVSLYQQVLDRLDEIWPGPGGEAPAAYAW